MSSEHELCPHCNKKGTIPYYYLGWGPKINLWVSDPTFCKFWHTALKKSTGLDKRIRKVLGFTAKMRYGMVKDSQSCNGFGIRRRSGNYLPNAIIVKELSQYNKLILLVIHLMGDRS